MIRIDNLEVMREYRTLTSKRPVEIRGMLPCGYVDYTSDNMKEAVNRWISWLMVDTLKIRSGIRELVVLCEHGRATCDDC